MKSNSSGVVVIGAGVMGCAAAMHLASRGHDVTLLEQFALDHRRGSSHGASRIFRLAYEEPDYVRLARGALLLWHEAESQLQTQLIERTGALDIGPPARLDPLSEALSEVEVPFNRLSKADATRRFPSYCIRDEWEVIYQPDGGVTFADRALTGFVELARRSGAKVLPETKVTELDAIDGGVRVQTTAGTFSSQSVVVSAAGWANKLLGTFDISIPLRVTCEQVAYYETTNREDEDRPRRAELQNTWDEDRLQRAEPQSRTGHEGRDRPRRAELRWLPFIWHEEDPEIAFYGLPNGNTGLIKVAQHGAGPEIDPDVAVAAEEKRSEPVNRFVESRLRGLRGKPAAFETCLYASTPDDDFVIDRVDNVIMAVGFGGHGFKFAPLVGKMVADLVEGKEAAIPRFSIRRFGAQHQVR